MIIKNPYYESYEEIQNKYNGYCVFIIKCKGNRVQPIGGEVVAYNEDLGALTKEIQHIINSDEDLGLYTIKTLKDVVDIGIVQVLTHA